MDRKMKKKAALIYKAFVILGLFLFISDLQGQTCSCAAAPLFNPLDLSVPQNKTWRLELSFKYHAINDLVQGTEKVIDDTDRERIQQSLLLDVRYAFSRKLVLRTVFSLVRQYRDVGISFSEPVSTQGVGDMLVAVQYTPLFYSSTNRFAFSLGGGVKAPVGESNAQIIGVAAEDMQPGTGSWDILGWGLASYNFPIAAGLDVFSGVSARYNGENEREYSFGDEVTAALGGRIYPSSQFDLSLYGRFRWADFDQRFGSDVPNTGGTWIYLVPGASVRLWQNLGLKTEVDIPIYRNLNGFRQFTSSFLVSVSIFVDL
jgi:hypothetical protein